MPGFLFVVGIVFMVLGPLSGAITIAEGGPFAPSLGVSLIASGVVGGALVAGFGKLLDKVYRIHDRFVDEEQPARQETVVYRGRAIEYRYALSRQGGRWGGKFAIKGGPDSVVEHKFNETWEAKEFIQKAVYRAADI